MAEIWDVYDEDGKKTGRTMERGEPKKGDYLLCTHVYLHTPDGKFLVQKRSKRKESHPGEWDVTGGAVLCGEDSLAGARRETLEEVGIDINDAKISYIGRVKKRISFADIYFVEKEFSLSDCTMQKEEVDEIRFVDAGELLNLKVHERFADEEYTKIVERALGQMAKSDGKV